MTTSKTLGQPRYALYINRLARSGAQATSQVATILQALGLEIDDMSHLSLEQLKKNIQDKSFSYQNILIGSGDGTLNALLDTLIDNRLTLGIIPLGTSNNFARNLELPLDLNEACLVIAKGKTQTIDVASVNDVKFANVLGLGLSVKVNKELPKGAKKFFGRLAYVVYAMKLARQAKPFHVSISAGQEVVRLKTLQVTVCHGRYYGPGITIAEDARLDDGLLNLVAPKIDAWWKGLSLLPALIAGKIAEKKLDVVKLSAPMIRLETRRPRKIDADGEIVAKTPATLKIHRQCLKVFVP